MKGITIACPHCKKVLVRYANIAGDGSFEMLCPHCSELVVVAMGQKPWLTATLKKGAVVMFILMGLATIYNANILSSIQSQVTAFFDTYGIETE